MLRQSNEIETYERLQSALGAGWTVEPPVYLMSDPTRRERAVLQFILWREGRPRVATVEDSPAIRDWIDGQHWHVVPLR